MIENDISYDNSFNFRQFSFKCHMSIIPLGLHFKKVKKPILSNYKKIKIHQSQMYQVFLFKSNRMSRCVSVSLTTIVFFTVLASHRFWDGLYLFCRRVPPSSKEKSTLEKETHLKNFFLLFLFKLKIECKGEFPSPHAKGPLSYLGMQLLVHA